MILFQVDCPYCLSGFDLYIPNVMWIDTCRNIHYNFLSIDNEGDKRSVCNIIKHVGRVVQIRYL